MVIVGRKSGLKRVHNGVAIPLCATALRRGHDKGKEPIKINETNGTFPHILICMMVKVPAVLIATKSYLTDLANLLRTSGTLHVLTL
jgi:hypothetical protein